MRRLSSKKLGYWIGGLAPLALLAAVSAGCSAEDTGSPSEAQSPKAEPTVVGEVRVKNDVERERMRQHLAGLYDDADVLHRFTSLSGDKIDCVRIERQPGLRDSALTPGAIPRAPSTLPVGANVAADAKGASELESDEPARLEIEAELKGELDTDGHRRACPNDTVPVLHLSMDTLERFETLDDFRQKVPSHLAARLGEPRDRFDQITSPSEGLGEIEPPTRVGSSASHQYAHAYQSVGNWGAESNLNIWNPYTAASSEFSLSQIWVTRGGGSNLETVEAGWQKYKDLYGDYNARLFIYFTPDNYGAGGCYNLTCGAFVQTDTSIVIGGKFNNYSSTGGSQYAVKLLWYKDGTAGDWWLKYENTWVGYYPRSKFDSNGLKDSASYIDFGGEIIDNPGGGHTATDMGSGAFSYLGWQQAAYQRNIQYVDTSNYYQSPSLTSTYTDYWCYDISLYSGGTWGKYFYFGGSGYNTECQ